MIEIKVPQFGESIIEGTISQWLKKQGERVTTGEVIVEIETDKVNAEVAAEKSGILSKISKQAGEIVQVGEVIALLEQQDEINNESQSGNETVAEEAVETKEEDKGQEEEV